MRFAFSSNAFGRYSLTEAIGLLADMGYQGIEIMADVPHAYPAHLSEDDIRQIRRALRSHRMEISNVNAFMHNADGDTYHPSWVEKDPAERARRVQYTLEAIDLAERLGASTISTEPGGPLEDVTRGEGFRFFKEGLAAIEAKARSKGIRVLIEPEPGLLIENSSQFIEFHRELDPTVFGLNFDIGHFFCVGEDPSTLVNELKDYTYHFHLEDIAHTRQHYHLLLGEGAIDISGVLKAIEQTGYDGFVTVELYTYAEKPVEAALKSIAYLNEWLQTSERGAPRPR
jgi:sugar phosphate isomerase/epimerase